MFLQIKNLQTIDGFNNNLRLIGVEPITFGTEIRHSIQLSYKRKTIKIMIQPQTMLTVSDNSGAKTVKCIKVLKKSKRYSGCLGDILIVSVTELRNKFKIQSKVLKGELYKAVVVRTKYSTSRKEGFSLYFFENSVCLLNKLNKPVASRVLGPIPKELRKRNYMKLANISHGFI